MIDCSNCTISYGHILARKIRSAVESIPEPKRPELAKQIRTMDGFSWLTGYSTNPKVKAYAIDLLEGRKPSQPLGQKIRRVK